MQWLNQGYKGDKRSTDTLCAQLDKPVLNVGFSVDKTFENSAIDETARMCISLECNAAQSEILALQP